jgi:hypothetical protein
LQQLPGRTIRIYKVIDRHEAAPGAPTEFRFTFNKDCTEKKCASDWRLSDKYSYLGHNGVTLIDPNEQSDVIAEGKPVGFFTEPVARDANRAPVYVDWRLDGDTVHIKVHDYTDGIKYPVVVDPHWFVGAWLVKNVLLPGARNADIVLVSIGCGARGVLDWTETVGQPWYRRVWHASLKCLEIL